MDDQRSELAAFAFRQFYVRRFDLQQFNQMHKCKVRPTGSRNSTLTKKVLLVKSMVDESRYCSCNSIKGKIGSIIDIME